MHKGLVALVLKMLEELVLAGVAVVAKVIKNVLFRRQNAKRKVHKRNVWVKPWIGRRTDYGGSNTLLKELKNEDPAVNGNILRILDFSNFGLVSL